MRGNAMLEIVIDYDERMNSLDLEDFEHLETLMEDVLPRGARAVLLRGEGRSFCTGRNLKGMRPDEDILASVTLINRVLLAWRALPVPTVAAVQGQCLGAGVGLALLADLTIVASDARIASPFAQLGAVADCGFHAVVTERLGEAVTKDMILTGRALSGQELADRGLVARSVDGDVAGAAREIAATLAEGPTLAFAASLDLVDGVVDGDTVEVSIGREALAQDAASRTHDYAAGLRAFLERTSPRFVGR
jgi:enoyl-CoA hydratase/carnithine racemase